jgi:hypothetical protein
MFILRLFVGTLYDLGRLMAAVSIFGGFFYLAKSVAQDSQSDFSTAATYFILSLGFWILARIFRRYAI